MRPRLRYAKKIRKRCFCLKRKKHSFEFSRLLSRCSASASEVGCGSRPRLTAVGGSRACRDRYRVSGDGSINTATAVPAPDSVGRDGAMDDYGYYYDCGLDFQGGYWQVDSWKARGPEHDDAENATTTDADGSYYAYHVADDGLLAEPTGTIDVPLWSWWSY